MPRNEHRFPSHPTAAALACVLALAGLPALAQPAAATAPPASADNRSFSIPAGPLGSALDRFARTAGVNLSYEPALVAGLATPGLSGTMPVGAALSRLLAGTGLEALAQPGGGYSLRRAAAAAVPAGAEGAATLPAVRVTAAQERPGDLPPVYAGGQVARGSRTGMLGNSDVFETPFNTKAWSSELVRNQGARTVNDMVANDPSIRTSLSATSPLDQSSIRGFLGNSDAYLFDGVEGLFAYSSVPVRHYERLEVLKGPAGGLVGASGYGATVGGSFNLVPKRATDAPVRSVSILALDKSLLGAHADIGQRFGVDQQLGARLNLSAEDGKLYDGAQRRLIAPQVALDYRGEKVRVVLDAGITRRESSPLFGHWLLQAGAAVPAVPDPHVHAKPSWEKMDLRQTYGLLSAEWDFASGWTAHARHGRMREAPPVRQYVDQTTLNGAGEVRYTSASSLLWTQANQVTDLGVRGEFQWGSVRHKLAVGTVLQRQQLQNLRSISVPLAAPVVSNIYQPLSVPDPFANGIPPVVGVDSPALHLDSLAVADTLALLDERLLLTLAARHQRIEKAPYRQSRITPTVAALYKLGGGVSLYGNYAEALAQGAIAPAGSANAGEQLEPYLSKQHELGLKWDQGSYGVTLAYFNIRRATAFVDGSNVFRAAGLQRNKGVELETFGELARGLRLLGGVAWTDGRMARTAGGTADGKKAIGVPELTANLGAEYDLPAVPGLTLTGRYLHTGSAYVDLANTQRVPAWNRVDVGVRYRTAVGDGTTMTLQAGITNLADKAYWTIAGRNFIAVAPPRTWQVSASFDF
ncbi:iron complex outermembrane receptor protein [Acidovorax soli]|uniref:Iron complex outermembrane receptor protein n=1 Tax=Acidovorax soli TaxID=592050 RepID=A0A7X0P953_9BURK|nr:TonB-dependent receptor [Acidovorax soli]MBB6557344.1 iron complex outermembrane receptor protein [Acidovorax soli]